MRTQWKFANSATVSWTGALFGKGQSLLIKQLYKYIAEQSRVQTEKRNSPIWMNRYGKKVSNIFQTHLHDEYNIQKSSNLAQKCRQESFLKISNLIFSTGWSGNPDFFVAMSHTIKKSVYWALICLSRWPIAFKPWLLKFRDSVL